MPQDRVRRRLWRYRETGKNAKQKATRFRAFPGSLCAPRGRGQPTPATVTTQGYNRSLITGSQGVGRGCGVGRGRGVTLGVAVGVAVAVGVGVGVGVGVIEGVAVGVGVGVGPEGVMLKDPLVEELFWKRTSLAMTRTRTSAMPDDGGSCQS
jgi:hypothetical protein